SNADRFPGLALLHGSLMIFLVLTTAPQAGFGTYLLPVQVGAREIAFPKLGAFGFWATAASLCGMTAAFFLPPASGILLWTASVAVFCAGVLASSLNLAVSVIDLRAQGMTFPRLPITVWAWFVNALLSLLIFSILMSVCVCLLADGLFGARIFPASQPSAFVAENWQRLFWFFARAQVFTAMLPCLGLVTHLLATFARRPVWAHRAVLLALAALGIVGFYVWGEHLFTTGLDPSAPQAFARLGVALGFPGAILVLSWFGTLWNAKVRINTSMLFAVGFISLFLSGGLSG